jgi:hypothetical protein
MRAGRVLLSMRRKSYPQQLRAAWYVWLKGRNGKRRKRRKREGVGADLRRIVVMEKVKHSDGDDYHTLGDVALQTVVSTL